MDLSLKIGLLLAGVQQFLSQEKRELSCGKISFNHVTQSEMICGMLLC